MIKKELRRAKQRKDWKTVQELETILKTQDERRQINKNIAKMEHDMQMSKKGFIATIIGAIITAVGLAIKVLTNQQ